MADLHVGIKGKDENLKGLFGGSTLDRNLFRKEKESPSQSSVFLSEERVALPQSLFLLSPLQLTLANERIAHMCLLKPPFFPVPSQI